MIEDLSAQAVTYVPSFLSNKPGRPLPTVTEEKGPKQLTEVAWKAIIILNKDSKLFVSELRRRAKVVFSSYFSATGCTKGSVTPYIFECSNLL